MNALNASAVRVGDALINASRQVWLAGLGAAVVTRDWAENEAGAVFRNLVREGTAVESRTMRLVGGRLESSFVRANTIWKRARSRVTNAVRAYAGTAATLVRDALPSSLLTTAAKAERPATRRKPRAVRGRTAAKPAARKRTAKKPAKRG